MVYVAALPEPGQLVEVRQRPYVVQEVEGPALPTDPLRADPAPATDHHLVALSSLEDDALGEELRVIWELEPGARIYEGATLPTPDGFDPPGRLDAFLDAVRWGAISSADVRALQAPFRSGIAIEDYQLDPVARAIQMPRANLLVADDVGLGKTIEAGLVAQELILRHRVHSVLVVCPSALQVQWRDQMRDKFGLEFRIVDSALMRELRRSRGLHVNPWTHFPRLITSIDYLKRERPLLLFRETLPGPGDPLYPRRLDLLIVDEAHNVAPSGRGRYATDSERTRAIRLIAPHAEHRLFLSATPHNGYPESFTALLELLDDQRFARGVPPDREQLATVMVRRLKSDLEKRWDGSDRFPPRRLAPIEVAYSDEERAAHRLLRAYTLQRRQGSRGAAESVAAEFVLTLLKKRLFSSPAAFAVTLATHEESLAAARAGRGGLAAAPPLGLLRRQIEGIDEEFADDESYAESTAEALGAATRLFRDLTPDERALLRRLREWAHQARQRPDSKASELLRWLDTYIRPGGVWGHERVIIFTEYRETQRWLADLLAAHGFAGGDRLMLLYGGMETERREEIKAAFQAGPHQSEVRILLATDAASEGIDLQNHCARLIHYEIPWNPNRMEQRNGRIDRHGQRAAEVLIYHFVGAGYQQQARQAWREPGDLEGDLEFLMRAAEKIETIREDLGRVGPVLAAQVEEAMLGTRTRLETAQAERDAGAVRAMLRVERRLRERVERLHEQVQETTRALRLSPQNIHSVIATGLELAGQPPLRPATLPGVWPDPTGRRRDCPVFHLPALKGSWAPCAEGLEHPHTHEVRPIVFDHALAEGRDDVVLLHLNHRLAQMCLRLLRAEVWSSDAARRLYRVTARLVPDSALEAPAVIAHARLVVVGGDSRRLHEEIISAGGLLRQGRLARLNVGQVRDALAVAGLEAAPEAVQRRLAALWPDLAVALRAALEARLSERMGGLLRLLEERTAKELEDSAGILRELRAGILRELDAIDLPQQLRLFDAGEQEQLRRDVENLRARAAAIPGEIEREQAAIAARYANPTPHLFPVAVTYLVPERVAREAAQ